MPTTYTLIASNVLGSNQSTVTFSSITSAYTDLVFLLSTRNTAPSPNVSAYVDLNINGDTSAIYSIRSLYGNGTTAGSQNTSGTSTTSILGASNSLGSTANTFDNLEIYIPNYTSSRAKQISAFGVAENNGAEGYIQTTASLINSTATISSVTLKPTGYNFVSGSSFYLYGIKNS